MAFKLRGTTEGYRLLYQRDQCELKSSAPFDYRINPIQRTYIGEGGKYNVITTFS